jgi:hypothetical protein
MRQPLEDHTVTIARLHVAHLSRSLHARCCHEPLPLRLLQ